jgi:precorrin-6B methylase 2
MKSVALLAVLTVLLILPPRAMAQGFRGAATGAGNSLAPARSGTTMSPARSGTPGSVIITTTPKPAVTAAPGAPIQSTPHAAVPQFVPPVVHGGGLTVAPANPLRHPPTVVIEIPGVPHRPPFPHRPRPAHRPFPPHRPYPPIGYYPYPGIVIFDSSYYWPNTVITEMAPGVVVEERRYTDAPPAESRTRVSGQLAPFDPTPQEVVDRMLRLAAVKAGDLLYDLGAGDGRVVIAAAKKDGVKAVGFEIDPGLVKLARENVRKQGVEHLVEIRQQDFLTADLSLPSVVTLYLSYDGNQIVRPRLMSQLKPGARVVSYTFDMAEWQPKIAESYRDAAGNSHMIYLWEIGSPLAFGNGRR